MDFLLKKVEVVPVYIDDIGLFIKKVEVEPVSIEEIGFFIERNRVNKSTILFNTAKIKKIPKYKLGIYISNIDRGSRN